MSGRSIGISAALALLGAVSLAHFALHGTARAQAGHPAAPGQPRSLACAVEAPLDKPAPAQVCQQLGKALSRTIHRVEDARKASHGDAVQIIRDDVQWTVVLLQEGRIRSWTRVSAADAQGHEADYFARALRVLMRTDPKPAETCVRVVPSEDRSARAPDLVYPWAELKPCVRRSIEVVDPWWK